MTIHCDVPGCITLLGRLSPEVREDGRRYCFVHDTMADTCEGVVESFQWLQRNQYGRTRLKDQLSKEIALFGAKICPSCTRRLAASSSYYHHDRSQLDGLTRVCKLCRGTRDKAYAAANREHRSAIRAEWGRTHREERNAADRARRAARKRTP